MQSSSVEDKHTSPGVALSSPTPTGLAPAAAAADDQSTDDDDDDDDDDDGDDKLASPRNMNIE